MRLRPKARSAPQSSLIHIVSPTPHGPYLKPLLSARMYKEEKKYFGTYTGKTIRSKYQKGTRFAILVRQDGFGVIGVCYAIDRRNIVLYSDLHHFLENWSKLLIITE